MISFKKFFTQLLLSEAISLKNVRKKGYRKKYSGAYTSELDEIFGNKNRIILPLKIDSSNLESPIYQEIKQKLYENGYRVLGIKDYIRGIAYKRIGDYGDYDDKNVFKIGKLLQKFEEEGDIEVRDYVNGRRTIKKIKGKPLLHEFKKDPIRVADGDFLIVISRHPYDIAGASTDRSWTSCMDLGLPRINYPKKKAEAGQHKRYIEQDISEGSLVAYVVSMDELYEGPNGEEKVKLKKPLSRILIKPHPSDSGKLYSIGKMYGSTYPEFDAKIKEWIKENLNNKLKGNEKVYRNRKLYRDSDDPVGFDFNKGNEIADEVLKEILTFDNDEKLLGDQITFETYGDRIMHFNLKIRVDFNEDIVRPFEDLEGVTKSDLPQFSEIEKNIAKAVFDQLDSDKYRSLNLEPINIESLGNGISINANYSLVLYSEEDKYIDDDYIYDTLSYGLEPLKKFDYNELKRELYDIVKNYDWEAHEQSRVNAINTALETYKNKLNSIASLNKSIPYIENLRVISPEKMLESDAQSMQHFYQDLRYALGGIEALSMSVRQAEHNLSYIIRTDERYKESKHSIFNDWFRKKFNLNIQNYRKQIDSAWSYKKLIDMYRNRSESGNPIPNEEWELIKDIDHVQDRIIGIVKDLGGNVEDDYKI